MVADVVCAMLVIFLHGLLSLGAMDADGNSQPVRPHIYAHR